MDVGGADWEEVNKDEEMHSIQWAGAFLIRSLLCHRDGRHFDHHSYAALRKEPDLVKSKV